MYVSVFHLFKIGIGPSSSHTVGPINASHLFIQDIGDKINSIFKIQVNLYGSLAYTGKGHGTDLGIIAGLLGFLPEDIDINTLKIKIDIIKKRRKIKIQNHDIEFNLNQDIKFICKSKKRHKYSNAIEYNAYDKNNKCIVTQLYYSIGGGFIINHNESKQLEKQNVKYDYKSADDLLEYCLMNRWTIAELILKNEILLNDTSAEDIEDGVLNIWKVMNKSIYNGMQNSGKLNGNLNISRRANTLYKKLIKEDKQYDPLDVMDWVNVFAISVAEENASFGRIVTAPTNGAAGIIPAVIKYYAEFVKDSNESGIVNFLLTASAIGVLYKKNASISGAEAGCQGEVGVACSMAAAGLVAAMNGTNEQIENAAEIGMEHNLGLTCDPINGLVQIPCIERNAMGAMKAINAARISLNGSGKHKVSLDEVIETMWETGKNMSSIYKETSKGGLAVNVSEC